MKVDRSFLELLNCPKETLFLRIITEEDHVLLREASADRCPGHADWVKEEPGLRPACGFALTARGGLVYEIFRTSILNPADDGYVLTEDVLESLKKALPLADDLAVYGT